MSWSARAAGAAAGAGVLVLLAVWWWAPPAFQPDTPLNSPNARAGRLAAGSTAIPFASASPGDVPWRPSTGAHDGADALLAPGLRDTLEDLLLAAGANPDPASLKRRLAELVAQYFEPALATRALAMAERYVDYRVALGELRLVEDISQPEALRASVDARDALRRQFFDEDEYAALFADQEALDQYTLARLQIEQDANLSAADRTIARQQAEAGLSDHQRAARAYSQVQVEVASQTARFDAEGTDERSRWSARSAQFGEGAATRLAALDAQDREWNQRLDVYLRAQQAQAGDEALRQLRAQIFSPEESLRLNAALAIRSADLARPTHTAPR